MIDRYVVGGFTAYIRPRPGREPQRAGHAFRAAGVRYPVFAARLRRRTRLPARTGFTPTAWWRGWRCWRPSLEIEQTAPQERLTLSAVNESRHPSSIRSTA